MGYYDIRQISPFLAGPSIVVSISQDYRHYPHHYDSMITSPCNQGPANYYVTRWRWSAVLLLLLLLLLLSSLLLWDFQNRPAVVPDHAVKFARWQQSAVGRGARLAVPDSFCSVSLASLFAVSTYYHAPVHSTAVRRIRRIRRLHRHRCQAGLRWRGSVRRRHL